MNVILHLHVIRLDLFFFGWRCSVVAFVDARVVAAVWAQAGVASFDSCVVVSDFCVVSFRVSCIRLIPGYIGAILLF